jgi:hypothetical protein
MIGAERGTRTPMGLLPAESKSAAATDYAISAKCHDHVTTTLFSCSNWFIIKVHMLEPKSILAEQLGIRINKNRHFTKWRVTGKALQRIESGAKASQIADYSAWHRDQCYPTGKRTALDWSRMGIVYGPDDHPSWVFRHKLSVFDWDTYDVSTAIAAGAIRTREVFIPESVLDHKYVAWDSWSVNYRSTETSDHIYLKMVGLAWLRSIGACAAATERSTFYGSADVYSHDLNVSVECGNTEPERMFAIRDKFPEAILVLPYSTFGELNGISGRSAVLFYHPDTEGLMLENKRNDTAKSAAKVRRGCGKSGI